MNKIIKIVINILFSINTVLLLSCYFHVFDFSFIKLAICSLMVIILFIINIIQIIRKDKILEDKHYIIMFTLVNIVVFAIFMRDYFDPMIPLALIYDIPSYNSFIGNGLFLDYNLIFITIMYAGIILYNLLNNDGKWKRKKR